MPPSRLYRAGESLEDFCRACKTDRMHTVIAADAAGRPLRVPRGYCGGEDNYRGGPPIDIGGGAAAGRPSPSPPATPGSNAARIATPGREPFPFVSERERSTP